ncbi:MAG: DUF433 domain-containing protein [Thermomicrobiales bacterium]
MSLINAIEQISAIERQELIAKYVVPDPHHPGIAQCCLRESSISVWALVAYYEAVGHDMNRVANDYDVPAEQIRAALAFYAEHTDAIDAYLSSRLGARSDSSVAREMS